MLKKTLSLILATALACSAGSALALNYSGSQGNEATFELLEEARVSAPAAVQHLELNESKTFVSFPVLDGIPEDTVYVYRSANLYGGRAAGRMNTNLLVYADTHFDTSDAALAYLKGLGLTDIIDAAIGSILLVTPADGVAFGQADQGNYYKLQTAICSLQAGGTDADGNAVTYAEPEYFGGFGYIYAIGIDGGASFLNNYVATTYDFVTRLAGMLLINGTMESRSQAAAPVPVYLVNAGEDVVRKYCAINGVNVTEETAETVSRYNQELPLQRVVTADGSLGDAWYVNDAYHGLFVKAMRLPVGKAGLYSAGTPYQGLGNDKAPYSLCERTDISSGVTAGGLTMIRRDEDRFSAYATETGEYIQTWFEYLPQDVLDNTAAPGSVPLILGIHGTNDDPRQYVDEIGLLSLAEHEHIAIVAPEHNALGAGHPHRNRGSGCPGQLHAGNLSRSGSHSRVCHRLLHGRWLHHEGHSLLAGSVCGSSAHVPRNLLRRGLGAVRRGAGPVCQHRLARDAYRLRRGPAFYLRQRKRQDSGCSAGPCQPDAQHQRDACHPNLRL